MRIIGHINEGFFCGIEGMKKCQWHFDSVAENNQGFHCNRKTEVTTDRE